MIKIITKYVLIISLFFLPFVAFGVTISPNTVIVGSSPVPLIVTCTNPDNYLAVSYYNNTYEGNPPDTYNVTPCSNWSGDNWDNLIDFDNWGYYDIKLVECDYVNYPSDCESISNSSLVYIQGLDGYIAPVATFTYMLSGGIDSLINTDRATFLATVGFSFDDLTTWSGDMIKMILGNGIGVLSNLMPWIIAIAVFMGILGLIWGGFRFFRH